MAKTYFIESEFLSFGKKINRRFHPAEAGAPIFSVKSVPIPLSGIEMVDFHQLFGKVIFLFAPEKKGLRSKAVNLQASFCHKGTKTQNFLLIDVLQKNILNFLRVLVSWCRMESKIMNNPAEAGHDFGGVKA